MKLTTRLWIYSAIITATFLFIIFEGWQDSGWWFVILGVCIATVEIGTCWSIRKRK
jgi:hypothetical protein